MADAPQERTCRCCGETKTLEDFTKARECRWGRSHQCKQCATAKRRQFTPGDPPPDERECRVCGEVKPFERFAFVKSCRWGRGHQCKDCITAARKLYDDLHPEWLAAWDKSRWSRQYREENFLAHRAYTLQKDAVKRGATENEVVVPLAVLERDDGVCGICGEDVDPFDFHVDHIIPCAQGGEHSYENVQLAHPGCNTKKSHAERRLVAA